MKNFKLSVLPVAPSKGINPPLLQEQFDWRKTKVFKGPLNQINIGDVKECFWWNRPPESDTLVKIDNEGLYSYNLPYIGNLEKTFYKTGYNILVTPNTIPIISHIQINPNWGVKEISILTKLNSAAVYDTLVELGVDKTKLKQVKNDILYEGKKFMGVENRLEAGVFSEDIVLTLKYTPEKHLFEKLTGEFALRRGIIGIMEETNCFTKEQFLQTLIKNIQKYVDLLP